VSDRVLSKYLNRSETTGEPGEEQSSADGNEDFGAFGWVRGTRDRAIMLELRKSSGDILAVGYSWIEQIEFVPSLITLHLGSQKITIKGRNLNAETRPQIRLFQGLTRHRVSFIQEVGTSTHTAIDKSTITIDLIAW
jgi:hypothetical protein